MAERNNSQKLFFGFHMCAVACASSSGSFPSKRTVKQSDLNCSKVTGGAQVVSTGV